MDHLTRVQQEFAAQAEGFDGWAEATDSDVEARFDKALGPAGEGDLLDLACGPGVVTAAVAKRARFVLGIDATGAMLDKAHVRLAAAGLDNVRLIQGDAQRLALRDGSFDAAVTRLSLHHMAEPGALLAEMWRVLKPGGTAVIVDVLASEDPKEAKLQNALERLRDPSHVEMLSATRFDDLIKSAGFSAQASDTWTKWRDFAQWLDMVKDPVRQKSLPPVFHALAEAGCHAGFGLSLREGQVSFFHRWRLVRAVRPDV